MHAKTKKLRIRNWCSFVRRYVVMPLQSIRFLWHLAFTFHPERKFSITSNLGRVANPRPVARIKTGRVSRAITYAADATGRDRSWNETRPWCLAYNAISPCTVSNLVLQVNTSGHGWPSLLTWQVSLTVSELRWLIGQSPLGHTPVSFNALAMGVLLRIWRWTVYCQTDMNAIDR